MKRNGNKNNENQWNRSSSDIEQNSLSSKGTMVGQLRQKKLDESSKDKPKAAVFHRQHEISVNEITHKPVEGDGVSEKKTVDINNEFKPSDRLQKYIDKNSNSQDKATLNNGLGYRFGCYNKTSAANKDFNTKIKYNKPSQPRDLVNENVQPKNGSYIFPEAVHSADLVARNRNLPKEVSGSRNIGHFKPSNFYDKKSKDLDENNLYTKEIMNILNVSKIEKAKRPTFQPKNPHNVFTIRKSDLYKPDILSSDILDKSQSIIRDIQPKNELLYGTTKGDKGFFAKNYMNGRDHFQKFDCIDYINHFSNENKSYFSKDFYKHEGHEDHGNNMNRYGDKSEYANKSCKSNQEIEYRHLNEHQYRSEQTSSLYKFKKLTENTHTGDDSYQKSDVNNKFYQSRTMMDSLKKEDSHSLSIKREPKTLDHKVSILNDLSTFKKSTNSQLDQISTIPKKKHFPRSSLHSHIQTRVELENKLPLPAKKSTNTTNSINKEDLDVCRGKRSFNVHLDRKKDYFNKVSHNIFKNLSMEKSNDALEEQKCSNNIEPAVKIPNLEKKPALKVKNLMNNTSTMHKMFSNIFIPERNVEPHGNKDLYYSEQTLGTAKKPIDNPKRLLEIKSEHQNVSIHKTLDKTSKKSALYDEKGVSLLVSKNKNILHKRYIEPIKKEKKLDKTSFSDVHTIEDKGVIIRKKLSRFKSPVDSYSLITQSGNDLYSIYRGKNFKKSGVDSDLSTKSEYNLKNIYRGKNLQKSEMDSDTSMKSGPDLLGISRDKGLKKSQFNLDSLSLQSQFFESHKNDKKRHFRTTKPLKIPLNTKEASNSDVSSKVQIKNLDKNFQCSKKTKNIFKEIFLLESNQHLYESEGAYISSTSENESLAKSESGAQNHHAFAVKKPIQFRDSTTITPTKYEIVEINSSGVDYKAESRKFGSTRSVSQPISGPKQNFIETDIQNPKKYKKSKKEVLKNTNENANFEEDYLEVDQDPRLPGFGFIETIQKDFFLKKACTHSYTFQATINDSHCLSDKDNNSKMFPYITNNNIPKKCSNVNEDVISNKNSNRHADSQQISRKNVQEVPIPPEKIDCPDQNPKLDGLKSMDISSCCFDDEIALLEELKRLSAERFPKKRIKNTSNDFYTIFDPDIEQPKYSKLIHELDSRRIAGFDDFKSVKDDLNLETPESDNVGRDFNSHKPIRSIQDHKDCNSPEFVSDLKYSEYKESLENLNNSASNFQSNNFKDFVAEESNGTSEGRCVSIKPDENVGNFSLRVSDPIPDIHCSNGINEDAVQSIQKMERENQGTNSIVDFKDTSRINATDKAIPLNLGTSINSINFIEEGTGDFEKLNLGLSREVSNHHNDSTSHINKYISPASDQKSNFCPSFTDKRIFNDHGESNFLENSKVSGLIKKDKIELKESFLNKSSLMELDDRVQKENDTNCNTDKDFISSENVYTKSKKSGFQKDTCKSTFIDLNKKNHKNVKSIEYMDLDNRTDSGKNKEAYFDFVSDVHNEISSPVIESDNLVKNIYRRIDSCQDGDFKKNILKYKTRANEVQKNGDEYLIEDKKLDNIIDGTPRIHVSGFLKNYKSFEGNHTADKFKESSTHQSPKNLQLGVIGKTYSNNVSNQGSNLKDQLSLEKYSALYQGAFNTKIIYGDKNMSHEKIISKDNYKKGACSDDKLGEGDASGNYLEQDNLSKDDIARDYVNLTSVSQNPSQKDSKTSVMLKSEKKDAILSDTFSSKPLCTMCFKTTVLCKCLQDVSALNFVDIRGPPFRKNSNKMVNKNSGAPKIVFNDEDSQVSFNKGTISTKKRDIEESVNELRDGYIEDRVKSRDNSLKDAISSKNRGNLVKDDSIIRNTVRVAKDGISNKIPLNENIVKKDILNNNSTVEHLESNISSKKDGINRFSSEGNRVSANSVSLSSDFENLILSDVSTDSKKFSNLKNSNDFIPTAKNPISGLKNTCESVPLPDTPHDPLDVKQIVPLSPFKPENQKIHRPTTHKNESKQVFWQSNLKHHNRTKLSNMTGSKQISKRGVDFIAFQKTQDFTNDKKNFRNNKDFLTKTSFIETKKSYDFVNTSNIYEPQKSTEISKTSNICKPKKSTESISIVKDDELNVHSEIPSTKKIYECKNPNKQSKNSTDFPLIETLVNPGCNLFSISDESSKNSSGSIHCTDYFEDNKECVIGNGSLNSIDTNIVKAANQTLDTDLIDNPKKRIDIPTEKTIDVFPTNIPNTMMNEQNNSALKSKNGHPMNNKNSVSSSDVPNRTSDACSASRSSNTSCENTSSVTEHGITSFNSPYDNVPLVSFFETDANISSSLSLSQSIEPLNTNYHEEVEVIEAVFNNLQYDNILSSSNRLRNLSYTLISLYFLEKRLDNISLLDVHLFCAIGVDFLLVFLRKTFDVLSRMLQFGIDVSAEIKFARKIGSLIGKFSFGRNKVFCVDNFNMKLFLRECCVSGRYYLGVVFLSAWLKHGVGMIFKPPCPFVLRVMCLLSDVVYWQLLVVRKTSELGIDTLFDGAREDTDIVNSESKVLKDDCCIKSNFIDAKNGLNLIYKDLNGIPIHCKDLNCAHLNSAHINYTERPETYLNGANNIGTHTNCSNFPKTDLFGTKSSMEHIFDTYSKKTELYHNEPFDTRSVDDNRMTNYLPMVVHFNDYLSHVLQRTSTQTVIDTQHISFDPKSKTTFVDPFVDCLSRADIVKTPQNKQQSNVKMQFKFKSDCVNLALNFERIQSEFPGVVFVNQFDDVLREGEMIIRGNDSLDEPPATPQSNQVTCVRTDSNLFYRRMSESGLNNPQNIQLFHSTSKNPTESNLYDSKNIKSSTNMANIQLPKDKRCCSVNENKDIEKDMNRFESNKHTDTKKSTVQVLPDINSLQNGALQLIPNRSPLKDSINSQPDSYTYLTNYDLSSFISSSKPLNTHCSVEFLETIAQLCSNEVNELFNVFKVSRPINNHFLEKKTLKNYDVCFKDVVQRNISIAAIEYSTRELANPLTECIVGIIASTLACILEQVSVDARSFVVYEEVFFSDGTSKAGGMGSRDIVETDLRRNTYSHLSQRDSSYGKDGPPNNHDSVSKSRQDSNYINSSYLQPDISSFHNATDSDTKSFACPPGFSVIMSRLAAIRPVSIQILTTQSTQTCSPCTFKKAVLNAQLNMTRELIRITSKETIKQAIIINLNMFLKEANQKIHSEEINDVGERNAQACLELIERHAMTYVCRNFEEIYSNIQRNIQKIRLKRIKEVQHGYVSTNHAQFTYQNNQNYYNIDNYSNTPGHTNHHLNSMTAPHVGFQVLNTSNSTNTANSQLNPNTSSYINTFCMSDKNQQTIQTFGIVENKKDIHYQKHTLTPTIISLEANQVKNDPSNEACSCESVMIERTDIFTHLKNQIQAVYELYINENACNVDSNFTKNHKSNKTQFMNRETDNTLNNTTVNMQYPSSENSVDSEPTNESKNIVDSSQSNVSKIIPPCIPTVPPSNNTLNISLNPPNTQTFTDLCPTSTPRIAQVVYTVHFYGGIPQELSMLSKPVKFKKLYIQPIKPTELTKMHKNLKKLIKTKNDKKQIFTKEFINKLKEYPTIKTTDDIIKVIEKSDIKDQLCIGLCEAIIGHLLKHTVNTEIMIYTLKRLFFISHRSYSEVNQWFIYAMDERSMDLNFVHMMFRFRIVNRTEFDTFLARQLQKFEMKAKDDRTRINTHRRRSDRSGYDRNLALDRTRFERSIINRNLTESDNGNPNHPSRIYLSSTAESSTKKPFNFDIYKQYIAQQELQQDTEKDFSIDSQNMAKYKSHHPIMTKTLSKTMDDDSQSNENSQLKKEHGDDYEEIFFYEPFLVINSKNPDNVPSKYINMSYSIRIPKDAIQQKSQNDATNPSRRDVSDTSSIHSYRSDVSSTPSSVNSTLSDILSISSNQSDISPSIPTSGHIPSEPNLDQNNNHLPHNINSVPGIHHPTTTQSFTRQQITTEGSTNNKQAIYGSKILKFCIEIIEQNVLSISKTSTPYDFISTIETLSKINEEKYQEKIYKTLKSISKMLMPTEYTYKINNKRVSSVQGIEYLDELENLTENKLSKIHQQQVGIHLITTNIQNNTEMFPNPLYRNFYEQNNNEINNQSKDNQQEINKYNSIGQKKCTSDIPKYTDQINRMKPNEIHSNNIFDYRNLPTNSSGNINRKPLNENHTNTTTSYHNLSANIPVTTIKNIPEKYTTSSFPIPHTHQSQNISSNVPEIPSNSNPVALNSYNLSHTTYHNFLDQSNFSEDDLKNSATLALGVIHRTWDSFLHHHRIPSTFPFKKISTLINNTTNFQEIEIYCKIFTYYLIEAIERKNYLFEPIHTYFINELLTSIKNKPQHIITKTIDIIISILKLISPLKIPSTITTYLNIINNELFLKNLDKKSSKILRDLLEWSTISNYREILYIFWRIFQLNQQFLVKNAQKLSILTNNQQHKLKNLFNQIKKIEHIQTVCENNQYRKTYIEITNCLVDNDEDNLYKILQKKDATHCIYTLIDYLPNKICLSALISLKGNNKNKEFIQFICRKRYENLVFESKSLRNTLTKLFSG